jgi:hypothetical protein
MKIRPLICAIGITAVGFGLSGCAKDVAQKTVGDVVNVTASSLPDTIKVAKTVTKEINPRDLAHILGK